MAAPTRIRIDDPRPGVRRVTLARPEAKNAQDRAMLDQLDEAFAQADHDPDVRVIVLAAEGDDFSSGHDLQDFKFLGEYSPDEHRVYEDEVFLQRCWKWRNLRKPTIAQVQGRTIASGLMLIWPCDLIIASEDATFSDPVAGFGVNGHEFFVHAWELGPRKAKELLFRGTPITAEEAHRLGMVNHVVRRERLEEVTLDIAAEIADRSPTGVQLAKASVNASLDAQGLPDAVREAYFIHHLGHTTCRAVTGYSIDLAAVAKEVERARARAAAGTR
jgi:enoyl-CoA hydratase